MRFQVSFRRIALQIVLLLGAVAMLYPLLWMVSSSFKPEDLIFSDVNLWPREVTLSNFVTGWAGPGVSFTHFFTNSFVLSISAVIGNVLSCSLAAYAFARLDFTLRRFWFALMLGSIMLPQQVLTIPQYTLFHELGWINTVLPLIVPRFFAVEAFFVFLMVQFIRNIPRDLDDAARIDGAGPFRIYANIILPLSMPALVTTAIFTFIWTWDDFFSQLLYLSDVQKYTVPLGLRLYLDSTYGSTWGPLLAMSTLSLVPAFVFFLVFQRLLVEGIATSGLKG